MLDEKCFHVDVIIVNNRLCGDKGLNV